MSSSFTNPVYIMPAILLIGFGIYYIYGAYDRLGLATHEGQGKVLDKTYTPENTHLMSGAGPAVKGIGSMRYSTDPEYFALTLEVEGQKTVGLVASKEEFDSI